MSAHPPGPGTDTGPVVGTASVLTFGSLTTIVTSGEFDAGTSKGLAEALEIACTPAAQVVVDMTGLTFLDGAALRMIERWATKLIADGGSMRITNPPRVVLRLIRAAGTADILAF